MPRLGLGSSYPAEKQPHPPPAARSFMDALLRMKMGIIRSPRKDRGFTIVSNAVAQDARLSMRALGVLVRRAIRNGTLAPGWTSV